MMLCGGFVDDGPKTIKGWDHTFFIADEKAVYQVTVYRGSPAFLNGKADCVKVLRIA